MSRNEESRQQPRLTINKGFDSFDQFVTEYVSNLSKSGVFIHSDSPLPIGERVNLKFSVVMDGIETIEGEGEVVRVSNSPPGMGVVFRKLGAYSQKLIETLLTQSAQESALQDGPPTEESEPATTPDGASSLSE